MSLRLAICIPTHNRRAELERTLSQIASLDPQPDEILVLADGCADDSAEFVRTRYPRIRLIIHNESHGCIPSRNELFHATDCDLIFTLDDDSYPVDRDAIARARRLFEENPRLGAADFPERSDENPPSLKWELADFGPAGFRGHFVSAAGCFRARLFREFGGYEAMFGHMYEEPDFSLRLAAAGWQVRFEPALIVRHHWSGTGRSELRNHRRHARNEMWSVLLRCPMPWLLAVVPFRAFRQFGYACRRGIAWVLTEPAWWWQCLRGLGACLKNRNPIPWRAYRAWMNLLRAPHNDPARWKHDFDPA